MKRKKIKIIFLTSIIVMILVVIASYKIESHSQKLPAVVRSNKTFVSTEVSGTVVKYHKKSMQPLSEGDVIAKLENPKFTSKLQSLKQEREKYESMISSAQNGDILKLELFELEEDILKTTADLNKALVELTALSQKLKIESMKVENSTTKYEAMKNLFSKQLISIDEYEKNSNDHLRISSNYNKAINDSTLIHQEIEAARKIIRMQETHREILKSNVTILASKNQIELDKINSEISELEQDIENLTIVSPLNGVITDLRNRPGEKVKNGDVIAEISDIDSIWVTAYGNTFSRNKLAIGNKAVIYSKNNEKIYGEVMAISPVMEKVRSLSTSFETVNTYTKIEIAVDDSKTALQNITPGERLFVRIYMK